MRIAALIVPFGSVGCLMFAAIGQIGAMQGYAVITMALALAFCFADLATQNRRHRNDPQPQPPTYNVLVIEGETNKTALTKR